VIVVPVKTEGIKTATKSMPATDRAVETVCPLAIVTEADALRAVILNWLTGYSS